MLKNKGLPKLRYRPGTHALDTVTEVANDLIPGSFYVASEGKVTHLYQAILLSKSSQEVFVVGERYNWPGTKKAHRYSCTDKVRFYYLNA